MIKDPYILPAWRQRHHTSLAALMFILVQCLVPQHPTERCSVFVCTYWGLPDMGGDGGFGKGGFGDKGKGKGKKGKGKGKGKGKQEEKQWTPMTKLGRLVNDGKITCLEDIYLHSLPIKEPEIIDHFYPPGSLKDDVLKIHPVQKMTSAGQTNRFVCYVLVGDTNGHIGLGSKCAKEVATAIRGGIIAAKINLIPVRRGFWGNRIGLPHTVPMKVHGKCGSVRARLIPAPRGSGIVGSPVMKKMMAFAGISDCFTCSCGHTRTTANFAKATFEALKATYGYLTPDLWKPTTHVKSPFQEWSDYLAQSKQAAGYNWVVENAWTAGSGWKRLRSELQPAGQQVITLDLHCNEKAPWSNNVIPVNIFTAAFAPALQLGVGKEEAGLFSPWRNHRRARYFFTQDKMLKPTNHESKIAKYLDVDLAQSCLVLSLKMNQSPPKRPVP